jgi:hypothetical protein
MGFIKSAKDKIPRETRGNRKKEVEMSNKFLVIICILFQGLIFGQDVNILTEDEQKIGWIQLFDGTRQSMDDHWTVYRQNDPNTDSRPGNLVITDAPGGAWFGQTTGGGSDIRTKEMFTNFDVRFEYMISGNSGFFYRGVLLTNYMFQNCVEYALLDVLEHINPYRTNLSGTIYDVYVALVDNYKTFSTGEWNTVRVVAKGDSVYHYQNEELIGKMDGMSDEFKDIIRGDIPVPGTSHISKWSGTPCFTTIADNESSCDHDNDYRQTGYFGLQLSYGGEQRYRGFKLLDLTSGCKDPLYQEYHADFMEHDPARCQTLIPGPGCTDPAAVNFNAGATADNGSCTYTGCTNAGAGNYFCTASPAAFPCQGSNGYAPANITDDGSCVTGLSFGGGVRSADLDLVRNIPGSVEIHVKTAGPYQLELLSPDGSVMDRFQGSGSTTHEIRGVSKAGIYLLRAVTPEHTVVKKVALY